MRKKGIILEDIEVLDYAAEGKALARLDGKVLFIEGGAVPGDRVDVRLLKSKKDWASGRVLRLREASPERVEPFCPHFGTCGGCQWQMLPYERQLAYKQQQVTEQLRRLGGGIRLPEPEPILGADPQRRYRNKLEFTFSSRAYLSAEDLKREPAPEARPALGFHAPGMFDKVLDIERCELQPEPSNELRNELRRLCLERGYAFYDPRAREGWLRNLVVRSNREGELMVNLVLQHENAAERVLVLDHLKTHFPQIRSLYYTINPKWNDSVADLSPRLHAGEPFLLERLGDCRFQIGPKSFFQTNSLQAERMYRQVQEFAALTGRETLYDLYCGTGTIGIFLAAGARRVLGIELVTEAVQDARRNAELNGADNTRFFEGDVLQLCDRGFLEREGAPDVVVTDPPRAGMHPELVSRLLEMRAPRIVYVSCNPATQARDLALLDPGYEVRRIRPLDMFPHTHHIENIVLLTLREPDSRAAQTRDL